jgi:hypothetical protein
MSEELISEIDLLRRGLRAADTQEKAIAWMVKAHELLGFAANEIEKQEKAQVKSSFSIILPSQKLILPPKIEAVGKKQNILPSHHVWFQGETVVYGTKYQNMAWTANRNRKLIAEIERKK